MRVLVTVSSRHGGTGEIGRTVAQVLRDAGHEVTETDPDEVQGLEGVDAVVLGSSVYVGRLAAALRELVDRQAGRLALQPGKEAAERHHQDHQQDQTLALHGRLLRPGAGGATTTGRARPGSAAAARRRC